MAARRVDGGANDILCMVDERRFVRLGSFSRAYAKDQTPYTVWRTSEGLLHVEGHGAMTKVQAQIFFFNSAYREIARFDAATAFIES